MKCLDFAESENSNWGENVDFFPTSVSSNSPALCANYLYSETLD